MKIIVMFILMFVCRIDPNTLNQKILDFVKDVTFFRGSFPEEVFIYIHIQTNKKIPSSQTWPTLKISIPASTLDGGRVNELFGELGTQED